MFTFFWSFFFIYIPSVRETKHIPIVIPNIREVQQSVAVDFAFQTSDFMRNAAYSKPEHIAPESDVSADGAKSPVNRSWDSTHQGNWYIEEQRYGFDAVAAGLANDDSVAINRGLRIITWGFLQQQKDGSFACQDAFHSTSFFVEASAHALLLLQASKWNKIYAKAIEVLKPRVHRSAIWMIGNQVEKEGKAKNMPYTHRRYLVAAALGETGVLCADTILLTRASQYVEDGLALQNSSGFNPEKGGYDCSYHAVGLLYAEQYCSMVASIEEKRKLMRMLKAGCEWLESRMRPDGTLDPSGNMRTGLGQEKGRNDNVKTINYGASFRSFFYYSILSGNVEFSKLAEKLIEGKRLDRM